ncbi:phage tail protein [Candidatus Vondammii sp. HM_W22]|uniref:phage tail protein n=1 Tax=Candidatus Vondammii sp. HM_W22 TaxID=2687299 RepID=UPI001F136DD1|nr:phage tail protein [Candidatus Vondammii sp. HM_W22]
MKKLESLREHLLSSPIGLQEDDLLTFSEQGKVISFQGENNQHFELRYSANIIITDYSGDADQVAYLLLQWLKQNQPYYKEDAIEF